MIIIVILFLIVFLSKYLQKLKATLVLPLNIFSTGHSNESAINAFSPALMCSKDLFTGIYIALATMLK